MAKYLDPKADLTFKRVFGEHKNLLISFLNALLPLEEGRQIEAIEYLPTELVPQTPTHKDSAVDVRCEETGGRQFIVEMQMNWTTSFRQRVLLNASKAYVRQLPRGDEYHLLQPVYSLNLVNANFEPDLDEYYHYYRMVHYLHSEKVLEGLHLVFVELPKFKAKNLADRKMQVLWLRFLTEIGEETWAAPRELADDPHVGEALEIVEESAYNEAEMCAYERFWDAVSSKKTIIADAERELADARREATDARRENAEVRRELADARREATNARREAEEAERKKDEAEKKADELAAKFATADERLRQTVRGLKALNLSPEQIAAATGLSVSEIAAL